MKTHRTGMRCYNCFIFMNPASSFFKFVLGFLTFISVSFVVTYTVNSYTIAENEEQQTASAFAAMLEQK